MLEPALRLHATKVLSALLWDCDLLLLVKEFAEYLRALAIVLAQLLRHLLLFLRVFYCKSFELIFEALFLLLDLFILSGEKLFDLTFDLAE